MAFLSEWNCGSHFLDLILWVLKITLRIFSILWQKFQVIFNTCKNNENIIPSAMGQWRKQVCGFLFAYWGVSDCFCDGLMPQTFLGLFGFQLLKNVL
jgi:hypothetical protein